MTSSRPAEVDALDTIELRIGRLLLVGAVVGIASIAIGVALMAVQGIDPLAASFPDFRISQVVPDMLAGRPEGFLWAGLLVIIGTPIARVVGECATFAARRDRIMMGVAAGVLAVVTLSVVAALVLEG